VLFHLSDLARLAGREGEVDRFSVGLRPGVDPDSTAAELEALLPGARVVTSTRLAEESSTTFRVVERFHRAIGLVTLVAGAIFLACIMILKAQERRTEVAALRLAGVSRRTLLGWIMAEAALVAGVGGVLGIGVGRLASGAINRVYRGVYDTSLAFSTVTAGTVRGVLLLAVVLGLGAGLAAALHLLSLDPLEEVGR
jgi:putative ABC transport system permease protein